MTTRIIDTLSLGKIVQIRERLLKAAAAGKKVYRLESGDPSFEPHPWIIHCISEAAKAGKTHYIPNAGIPELRTALAAKLERDNGISVPSIENIFVTNGAMHALFATFHAILDEGSEVILPDPMWTEVAENVRMAGGLPVYVPLRFEENYEYNPIEIERRITPRTRAIFINTPHNPTGAVLSTATLRAIVDIAKRHDLWIVSDEAYEHIIYEPYQHVSVASVAGDWAHRVLSIFSFSKSFAMAGLRTGCLVAHSDLICERLQKILRCSINGVNSLAQWGAVAALQGSGRPDFVEVQRNMIQTYQQRRDCLLNALQDIPGIRTFEPRGTFFTWIEVEPSVLTRLRVESVEALSDKLCVEGVGNTPGDAFGPESGNALRLSFSCATSMVEEGALILRKTLTQE